MSAIFRQLTAGIKFDNKKYRHEAEKFGLVKKIEIENEEKTEEKLPVTLEDTFIPDSNLPTPDDSGEDDAELKLLGSISAKKEKWKEEICQIKTRFITFTPGKNQPFSQNQSYSHQRG